MVGEEGGHGEDVNTSIKHNLLPVAWLLLATTNDKTAGTNLFGL